MGRMDISLLHRNVEAFDPGEPLYSLQMTVNVSDQPIASYLTRMDRPLAVSPTNKKSPKKHRHCQEIERFILQCINTISFPTFLCV